MPFAPKNKIAFIAFLLIFAASWLFNLYYAHNYVGTEMKHDLFRQVDEILAPLWSGDGSLSLLWSNHHASPLLHLHQLANFKFFGGNYYYDAMTGLFLLTVMAIFASRLAIQYFKTDLTPTTLWMFCALTVVVVLTVLSGAHYTWPLISMQLYFVAIAMVLFWASDNVLRKNRLVIKDVIIIWLLSAIALLAHESYGALTVASSAGIFILNALYKRRLIFIFIAVVQLIFIVFYLKVIADLGPGSNPSINTRSLSRNFVKIITEFTHSTGNVFLETLTGQRDMFEIKHRSPVTLLTGAVLILFSCIYGLWPKRNNFIASLLAFSFMFAFSVCAFRIMFGNGFSAERYITSHKVMTIGLLWALVHFGVNLLPKRVVMPAITGMSVLLIISHILGINASIKQGERKAEIQSLREYSLVAMGADPRNRLFHHTLTIDPTKTIRSTLKFLKKEQLNVFHPDYPLNRISAEYLEAKQAFDVGPKALPAVYEKQKHCYHLESRQDYPFYFRIVLEGKKGNARPMNFLDNEENIRASFPVRKGHVTHFGVLTEEVSHFCLHPHHAELKSFQVKAIQ